MDSSYSLRNNVLHSAQGAHRQEVYDQSIMRRLTRRSAGRWQSLTAEPSYARATENVVRPLGRRNSTSTSPTRVLKCAKSLSRSTSHPPPSAYQLRRTRNICDPTRRSTSSQHKTLAWHISDHCHGLAPNFSYPSKLHQDDLFPGLVESSLPGIEQC